MLESQVQRKLIAKLTEAGWYVIRNIVTNRAGFPDLTLLKEGMCMFIEVKRPGGRAKPLQKLIHQGLRDMGFEVRVVDNEEQIKDLLNR